MVRDEFPGDHREVEPPVPIPNTKVKHLLADGTAVRPWESRSLPGFFSAADWQHQGQHTGLCPGLEINDETYLNISFSGGLVFFCMSTEGEFL